MAVARMTEMLRALTRGMAAEASVVSDRELVRRFLESGGEDAFEILVRRHGPMVYRVCWRVAGHDQDAEDAFQATFLVLARDLRTLRSLPSLASWLHGVARRVALKAKERAAALRRRERLSPARESAPPADPARAEVSAVLDEELSRLPERWRLPLVLCYLEQRTQDEAARELGWATRTLRRRLDEARAALATRLARRGVWPAVLAGVVLSDCVAPAAIPRALIGPLVHAATRIASRHPSAAEVADGVSTLTEGAFNVSQSKLKFAAAAFVAGALALGAGAALRTSSAAPPAGNELPTPANLPAPQPAPGNAEKDERPTPIAGPKRRVGFPDGGDLHEPPPPDISGKWYGAEWGHVELAMSKPGKYVGTYDDTFGPVKGSITLEWLPLEQRYQGKWGEGRDRFGTISVRLYGRKTRPYPLYDGGAVFMKPQEHDGELRGAYTADPTCKLRPGTPALSDLKWIPQSAVE